MTLPKQRLFKAMDILEKVKLRLSGFGIETGSGDEPLLGFCVQKALDCILNDCNLKELPDGLVHVAVDMAAGEYLRSKKQSGQLDIDSVDLSAAAVSSIKEGDTQVNFGTNSGQSAGERLDSLINWLISGHRGDIACYRRLRW